MRSLLISLTIFNRLDKSQEPTEEDRDEILVD